MTATSRRLAAGVGCALTVLGAPWPSAAQATDPVNLATGWEVLARPDVTDPSDLPGITSGPRVDLTEPWDSHGVRGHEGWIWYRRSVDLPVDLAAADRPVGLVVGPTRHGWYELWVDGRFLGGRGRRGDPLLFPLPQSFALPATALQDGRLDLVLGFDRVAWASDAVADVNGPLEGGLYLGDLEHLRDTMELGRSRRLLGELDALLFSVGFLIVGLYHLELYRRRRSQRAYLWFGLGATAFAANVILYSSWILEGSGWLSLPFRLTEASGHLAAACLIGFLWSSLDRPVGRWIRAYQLSHVALALFLVFGPFQWVYSSMPIRLPWTAPILVMSLWILVLAARKGHPEADVLLVGGAVFVLLELGELARGFGLEAPGFLPYAGFAVLILSMVSSLAHRFERTHTELDALRADLEARVDERTAQLARATLVAEGASHAKSRFLATMSHELRTPLNSVIGFANLLRRKAQLEPTHLDYVERIADNGKHLLAIIDGVLDLAKIEAGRLEVKLEETDIAELARDTVRNAEPLAQDKGIRLRVRLPPRPCPAKVDRFRLRQVLLNLIGNAVKFTEKGSVTVRLHVLGGRVAELEVADTGTGIQPEKLASIFEAFEQGEASEARRHGGTGLGLAISRSLCRLMGCELTVRSEVGRGSTFRIHFPPESAVGRDVARDPIAARRSATGLIDDQIELGN